MFIEVGIYCILKEWVLGMVFLIIWEKMFNNLEIIK